MTKGIGTRVESHQETNFIQTSGSTQEETKEWPGDWLSLGRVNKSETFQDTTNLLSAVSNRI